MLNSSLSKSIGDRSRVRTGSKCGPAGILRQRVTHSCWNAGLGDFNSRVWGISTKARSWFGRVAQTRERARWRWQRTSAGTRWTGRGWPRPQRALTTGQVQMKTFFMGHDFSSGAGSGTHVWANFGTSHSAWAFPRLGRRRICGRRVSVNWIIPVCGKLRCGGSRRLLQKGGGCIFLTFKEKTSVFWPINEWAKTNLCDFKKHLKSTYCMLLGWVLIWILEVACLQGWPPWRCLLGWSHSAPCTFPSSWGLSVAALNRMCLLSAPSKSPDRCPSARDVLWTPGVWVQHIFQTSHQPWKEIGNAS